MILKEISKKHKPIKQYLRSFLEKYSELFVPIRCDKLTILELGVGGYKNPNKGGGSLKMWAEFFPNSIIVGVDLYSKNLQLPSNAHFHRGSQTDVDFLKDLSSEYGGFDVVIDDASHITANTILTFETLHEVTRYCYVVEDLHMKSAQGTADYFRNIPGADFDTENLCVIKIGGWYESH